MINIVYGKNVERLIQLAEFAGRTCWKSHEHAKTTSTQFISNIVNIHHESVIEHSSIIFSIDKKDVSAGTILRAIMNVQQIKEHKEKNTHAALVETDTKWYFGMNIRGIKNMILTCKEDNMIRKAILSEVIPKLPPCFFVDFIKDGIIEEYFLPVGTIPKVRYNHRDIYSFITDLVELDADIDTILKENPELNHDGLSKLMNMTVRLALPLWAAEQILRHREGAVSKQSLRYTRADNCNYLIPESVKGKDIKISTRVFDKHSDETVLTTNFDKLANALYMSYNQFVGLGSKKEDARSIMPTATITDAVFTKPMAQWGHIFNLRVESHAQLYVRQVFSSIYLFIKNNNFKNLTMMLPDLDDIIKYEDLININVD